MPSTPLPIHTPIGRLPMWGVSISQAQVDCIHTLIDTFVQTWQAQPTRHACVVFDNWEGNHGALWLQSSFPAWAKTCQRVPDPAYQDTPERAPHLLALGDWPGLNASDPSPPKEGSEGNKDDAGNKGGGETPLEALTDALYTLLALGWLDSQRRLVRANVCGLLLIDGEVAQVLDHWTRLAFQATPDDQHLQFRHFDPRVLQRLWPGLSTAQRRTWLGPVHSYWQVAQPWGPWDSAVLGVHQHQLLESPIAWHIATNDPALAPAANAANTTPSGPISRLLNAQQIHLAETSAVAPVVWITLALAGWDVARQPSPQYMLNALHEATRWGLTTPQQWQDWVLLTWCGAPGHPQEDTPPLVHWDSAYWSGIRQRMQALIAQRPELAVPDLLALCAPTGSPER